MEGFAIYVKLWFAHTPCIADNAKDSARRTAESRFAQFQEYLVEQFQGGRRFVDDLPREIIADEAELSRMASDAPAASAVAGAVGGPMKSDRSAGKRALSDPRASKTDPDGSAHPKKPLIPAPPADRSLSARTRAAQSAAKNACARLRQTSRPSDTPSATPTGGRQAHVAVAVLDPTELLQLAGVECIAEPDGEPYGAPAAKRASRK